MTANWVELSGVNKAYRTKKRSLQAVDDFSLDVRQGEFVSLLGPSGCGKSTLLKIISGLVPATSGKVLVNGRQVTRPQVDIGFVFQDHVLLEWRRVLDNVMLQIEARRLPHEPYRVRALELLRKAGLGGFEHAYPHELSGGMSQRVSVCRALVHDPPLLLMDEPFGALDALTRDQMIVDLQRLWMGSDKTVVFVTHSVPEAIFLSDRVVVMTPRPGQVKQIVDIDLPRPRRLAVRSTEAFVRYVDGILEIFEALGVLQEETVEDAGNQGCSAASGDVQAASPAEDGGADDKQVHRSQG